MSNRYLLALRTVVRALVIAASVFLGAFDLTRNSTQLNLTMEERVAAQRAIERLYYSHQDGARRLFEEAVSDELLESKVRTYLRQSVALERFWNTPVTDEMLRAEMKRIERDTRFPERLREIYRALDDDPFVIQETFVRASLVDRLARNFFAFDARIHLDRRQEAEKIRLHFPGKGNWAALDSRPTFLEYTSKTNASTGLPGQPIQKDREGIEIRTLLEQDDQRVRFGVRRIAKTTWEEWWEGFEATLDERDMTIAAHPFNAAPSHPLVRAESAAGCEADDTWDSASLDDSPEARRWHVAVWTGSHMLIWGGIDGTHSLSRVGLRYDPLTDNWGRMSEVNAPAPRNRATAFWTGSHMIVWGGDVGIPCCGMNTGGLYDPVSDTWRTISAVDAPSPRVSYSAVWAGSRMIVWGGFNGSAESLDTGGQYDPLTDVWSPTSTINVPPNTGNAAVWTGKEMIVLPGSLDPGGTPAGGRYNPETNTWTPTSTPYPLTVPYSRAAWTGTHVLVWGALFDDIGNYVSAGIRYDPASDTWSQLSLTNAPEPHDETTAIWTGKEMIVWGGRDIGQGKTNTGGRYDPKTDTWAPTSLLNAPVGRSNHTAVWTGSLMLVWGGSDYNDVFIFAVGGRYDPASDTWTPTSLTNGAPEGRVSHTAVWTGTEMLVWGGIGGGGGLETGRVVASGGRYDPLTDAWRQMGQAGVPEARAFHTAVWTGERMVVWGGAKSINTEASPLMTGGLYDPISDTWGDLSIEEAPSPRWDHTAVWTGDWMVVWGGNDGHTLLAAGGRYDPISDTWEPTSLENAPSPRVAHTAIRAGERMVLWGGNADDTTPTGTGALYDPLTDVWQPTATTGAPSPRFNHSAVWTGQEMLVWGGRDSFCCTAFSSGGRYDPLSDSWLPMSDTGAPSPRDRHPAIWTGDLMVVWGGRSAGFSFARSGGRYSPAEDAWEPVSEEAHPPAHGFLTAVWTGIHMIVWGGSPLTGAATGGRYVVTVPRDADEDGFSTCGGDCDDADATINPAVAEICNGLDDDCDNGIDEDPGSLCRDDAPCIRQGCGGTAGCQTMPLPEGFPCEEDPPVECILPATCDGQGVCRNLFQPLGTPCGDGSDTVCTDPDSCDGAGMCTPNHEFDGHECRVEDDDDSGGHPGDDDDDGWGDHGGGHPGDDDDDGWGDHGGGHPGDDDDDCGDDDVSHICITGACVPQGHESDTGVTRDAVVDSDFDSLRVTLPGEELQLRWSQPSVPAGIRIMGYRVWHRDSVTGPWQILANVSTTSFGTPISSSGTLSFFKVTAVIETVETSSSDTRVERVARRSRASQ